MCNEQRGHWRSRKPAAAPAEAGATAQRSARPLCCRPAALAALSPHNHCVHAASSPSRPCRRGQIVSRPNRRAPRAQAAPGLAPRRNVKPSSPKQLFAGAGGPRALVIAYALAAAVRVLAPRAATGAAAGTSPEAAAAAQPWASSAARMSRARCGAPRGSCAAAGPPSACRTAHRARDAAPHLTPAAAAPAGCAGRDAAGVPGLQGPRPARQAGHLPGKEHVVLLNRCARGVYLGLSACLCVWAAKRCRAAARAAMTTLGHPCLPRPSYLLAGQHHHQPQHRSASCHANTTPRLPPTLPPPPSPLCAGGIIISLPICLKYKVGHGE